MLLLTPFSVPLKRLEVERDHWSTSREIWRVVLAPKPDRASLNFANSLFTLMFLLAQNFRILEFLCTYREGLGKFTV